MQRWTTKGLPASDRFDFWRETLCSAFTPLRPEWSQQDRSRPDRGTHSTVRAAALGSIVCAEVVSISQHIAHGPREVLDSSEDVFFVNLQLAGECRAQQGERRARILPGQFAVFDTSTEYAFDYLGGGPAQTWRVLSFRVPRENLLPLLATPSDLTCTTRDGTEGAGAVVTSTMRSIWRHIATLPSQPALEHAFTAMVAGTLHPTVPGQRPAAVASAPSGLREALLRHIDEHLDRDHLSASAAAAYFGVSVRTVHAAFTGTGTTFGGAVRDRRLAWCARVLSNPMERRSLTDIAVDLGFSDLSHLDRCFKNRYSCTPGEYRLRRVGVHPTQTPQ